MNTEYNQEMIKLLNICIINRKENLIKSINVEELSVDINLIDECTDFVLDEFCEKGLKDDSEPNEYGYKLEEIIEFLINLRYEFEKHDDKI